MPAGAREPDAADPWRSWRGACAVLFVLGAILLRVHPPLSTDVTFPHHDWLQVHEPGEVTGMVPPMAWRVFRARAFGPVIEIYRVSHEAGGAPPR
jgi:hypothetical protein